MTKEYKGLVASTGIAMANIYLFTREDIDISQENISKEDILDQTNKIKEAIDSYTKDLDNKEGASEQEQKIAEAHKELLSDPYFIDTISSKISNELKNPELALDETVKEMVVVMSSLDDEYLKERADDYKDIGRQVMYKLKGIVPKDLSKLSQKSIVVSKELTPSDTSNMDKENVLGFATDLGGKTSHTSIIAQTLDMPALVGMRDFSEKVKGGEFAIIDGDQGIIIVDPSEETIEEYSEKIKALEEKKKRLEEVKDKEVITQDGKKIEVAANIGNLEDLKIAIERGCDGVGLFRTEFIYMESDGFPSEESQFEIYRDAAKMLEGKPIIIRTLDIGGDKGLDYFKFPAEENPFLGYRAIRLCLDKEDMFRTQLRALLRASAFGNIKIMLPYIISVDELLKTREILEDLKDELRKENIDFNEDIDLGIMVETPASVIMADKLIKYADFFSIGTNDLTQYVLAVDRGNDMISDLYNPYNPAVLRAIKRIIDESHKAGKWTGMCGQFAGDTEATKLLLGLGLDEFSASSNKIAEIKDTLLKSSQKEEEEFANTILDMESADKAEESVKEHNK
ncbi:MAG: phosphoenolpyruvate--protein phosphotransferase [Anaerococcus sp.]|jgi:phosphotransferase system enzyme I (PtsI)|nr:phosphoenolpyruvate--protein phosphotransferase [Peptoniphilaceae bacterium]MDY3055971.1 phosphoenolpyruvate--protein phosphotransferase [Anaerococcus sp.]